MTIGEKIKHRRVELGWSQRDLAARMEYNNHSTITRIESGKVDIPQSRIVQFSEVLGVSIAHLMGWEEEEKNNDTITDAVIKMRTNADFLSVVECLLSLDEERLSIIKQTALAFKK